MEMITKELTKSTRPGKPILRSIRETAEILGGVHPVTVLRLADKGILKRVKVAARSFITDESITRVLDGEPAK
jgi:hypothetical protein